MCCKKLIAELKSTSSGCFETKTSAEENGKKIVLNIKGKKTICRLKIDDCYIKAQTENKCDYIFSVCTDKGIERIILVELKGTDVIHAVKQITSTFTKIKNKISSNVEYSAHIISSSVPQAAEQKFRAEKEKALKDHKLNINKKNTQISINV